MNKLKIIMVAVGIIILCVVGVALFRFIQNVLFSAAQELHQMGEAPIAEPTDEARGPWEAPTLPPDAFDIDAGIDYVASEDDQSTGDPNDADDDDDVQTVPVEETADELANTAWDKSLAGDQDSGALPD